MTKENIEIIGFYQRKGFGYKKISQLTGLSADAIKYYCRKNPASDLASICLGCGAEIQQTPHHRKRVFCSDYCRMKWWNRHPDLVNRKLHKYTCQQCGNEYLTHRATQKYCSRKCLYDARRKAVVSDE